MVILLEVLNPLLRALEASLVGAYAMPPPQAGFLNYLFCLERDAILGVNRCEVRLPPLATRPRSRLGSVAFS